MINFLRVFMTALFVLAAGIADAKDVYFCPMHTFYTSDTPGACPICGMNLVKKEPGREAAGEKTGTGVAGYVPVQVAPPQARAMGIATAEVRRRKLVRTIHAPGFIITKYPLNYRSYKDGSYAERNWGTVRVQVQLFEQDLLYVKKGQTVRVTVPECGEHEGTVRLISRSIDPSTRTAEAVIDIYNYHGEWATNLRALADIPIELDAGLVVPLAAVVDTGVRKIVFVETATGSFEPRAVSTGARGDDGWAVKAGLAEGERVVVDGNFLLDSESRLRASLPGGSHD